MKAIRINEFGLPEVMKLEEIARPIPAADEILVKVYASAVNPIDWKIRDGKIVSRLHVKIELPITPGWDAAGIVEEIGSNVTGFKKGDAVYGIPNYPGDGSYAEYVAAKARKFSLKPKSINFIEASAIPVSGVTAWDGVFNRGQLQPGQRILIHGAAGGVGHFAVQLAKWKGAYVIGTASPNNHAFLKQLGADEVIDYNKQDFEDMLHDLDVVFDAVALGNDIQQKSVRVLKENGTLVTTQGFPLGEDVTKALAKKNARGEVIYGEEDIREWLNEIALLVDENKIKVTVNKTYPLEKAAEAHRESEQRHGRGKLVLEVRKEDQHNETFQNNK
ncbi:NADP-dependent oxidoreductase [Chitinophaga japonensis]|uniref:NADPH:quinone reductase-like Zn-dependent oxidoreductase n=1 Tax=Chitinophaga japonensis TaxID=104662 RepID=A0A562SSK1_CHIJA|nr:NADP-dependent oxidoreductase [Chitinophaga japonensis]TWI84237.1 NADPH:quinone reductase-like Zn-dependent oxidoreductase [Chitinophaga japonensis]